MKKKLILLIILLGVAFHAQAGIMDVTVIPQNPTDFDLISLFVSGGEGTGPVQITNAVYNLDNLDITLDLSLEIGIFDIATPWDYTYDIGLLSLGTYDLTVNTLVQSMPTQNDTYITSFEVVPEPTTLFLISAGILCLRNKKH